MGLLDTVIGALAGGQGGVQATPGEAGTQGALLNAVIGMLANKGGGPGSGGGLGDLVGRFTQGGLGDVIGSWIGHGQNAPISGDQLGSVLGADMLGNLAARLGLSQGEVAGQLSQLLPQVVDRLTPNGEVPAGGLGGIGDILAQLAKR
ncbi:MAG: DUF937 domain-containing protein [Burkholderiales bacterium]|nr:DUF937 domain-containing protein [Burkholderiales bacterium]